MLFRRSVEYIVIDAAILDKGVTNYSQRIFLEALHSVINQDSVNEHA